MVKFRLLYQLYASQKIVALPVDIRMLLFLKMYYLLYAPHSFPLDTTPRAELDLDVSYCPHLNSQSQLTTHPPNPVLLSLPHTIHCPVESQYKLTHQNCVVAHPTVPDTA
jgi:hypothetical protein